MKKFLSIFIAMLLIVSLFATTAVAFAAEEATTPDEGATTDPAEEESPRDKVQIIKSKLDQYLADGCPWFNSFNIEMGDVKFGEEMMKSSTKIGEAFQGIQYVISGDPNYDTLRANNDKIYVEYCRPSESPKGQETWQNSALITDSIRVSSTGWYLFRFVIKDKDNKVISEDNPEAYYRFYAIDTSRPVVALSSTMKTKQESGLTAGTKYSIPTSGLTSGSLDEMSSTTVNFKVYKVVNKEDVLIYDSINKEVTKGYEDFVDVDGAITPSDKDISEDTVYKVVYSVVDAYGYTGVKDKADVQNYAAAEEHPTMELKVVAAPAIKNKSSVNVWEIVLFCIAGLSAIGIVVLLCIKPKEATAPSRVATANVNEEETASTDETQE